MTKLIPSPVIAVVAEILSDRLTHAGLDNLFLYANAPGEPPEGSKLVKTQEWLRRTNKNHSQPLSVLGKLIENLMELPASNYLHEESHALDKNKIVEILQRYGLQYQVGALVTDLTGTMVSKTLDSFIKEQDIPALELEFNRAIKNIDENPREAISAASNILETICKVYIDEQNLEKPAKQDLKSIWSIVRKDLGFKPERLEDKDLQTILTGLFAVIEGIGALRTHASSAHGAGVKPYNVQPRHSRLAVLSAHTAAVFILETWKYKTSTNHRAQ